MADKRWVRHALRQALWVFAGKAPPNDVNAGLLFELSDGYVHLTLDAQWERIRRFGRLTCSDATEEEIDDVIGALAEDYQFDYSLVRELIEIEGRHRGDFPTMKDRLVHAAAIGDERAKWFLDSGVFERRDTAILNQRRASNAKG